MYDLELLEDMDTSDDEHQDLENDEDDEWRRTRERKRRQPRKRNTKIDLLDLGQSEFRILVGVCCSCSKTSSCKRPLDASAELRTAFVAHHAPAALQDAAIRKQVRTLCNYPEILQ